MHSSLSRSSQADLQMVASAMAHSRTEAGESEVIPPCSCTLESQKYMHVYAVYAVCLFAHTLRLIPSADLGQANVLAPYQAPACRVIKALGQQPRERAIKTVLE